MAKMQEKPKINSNSRKMVCGKRMGYMKHADQYNKKQQIKIRFDSEMDQVTGKPSINECSKMMTRTVDDLYQWKHDLDDRNSKIRDIRNSESERELRSIKSVKLINPKSERIANKNRNFNEPIEDKLLREGIKNR